MSEAEQHAATVVLADGIADVVGELMTIDPVDLIGFIRFGRYPALEDLLQSSTELYFKDNTLTFGWLAAVEMDWADAPKVTLGMEFRHGPVAVFFDLVLQAGEPSVEIVSLHAEPEGRTGSEAIVLLGAALADARLARRATPAPAGRRLHTQQPGARSR